jgi:mono/diheme cytochrome c family protein
MRALLPLLLLAVVPIAATAQPHPGQAPYDRWCAACHGYDGRGDGEAAAWMLPRPRDFTRGVYQIRTTANGELPTDADLRRIIDDGMPGTSMPGWRSMLSTAERNALVDYIKTFSHFFEQGPAPEPIRFGRAPRATQETMAEGRLTYERIECWKCHGQAGRGDGPSAPEQSDDEGYPVRPADLTQPWRFNGGHTVDEIYRRLRTGLDGTPMPSFEDLIEGGFITDAQLWSVAHYVRSLGPRELPRVRDVVRGRLVEALPADVDDPAWSDVPPFYLPVVGQVVVRARWYAPSVDGVWVQALHDGEELALRLVWNDPSRSPDDHWTQWRDRVAAVMEPRDAPPPEGRLPDAIAVQFPRRLTAGGERPFFLMGSVRDPVYLWQWQSEPAATAEALGRGLARTEPIDTGADAVTSEATWEDGQWRLLLRRRLVVDDGTGAGQRLDFPTAQAIPFALFVWDGDNGEADTRGAISTWYYLYLDEPTSPTVFAMPLLATLLTAGFLLMLIRNAQRREIVPLPAPAAAAPQAEPVP